MMYSINLLMKCDFLKPDIYEYIISFSCLLEAIPPKNGPISKAHPLEVISRDVSQCNPKSTRVVVC